MKLTKKLTHNLLRQMHLIRAFEEQADQSYMEGKVHGVVLAPMNSAAFHLAGAA